MKSNSLMLIAALGTLTAVGVYVVRADEDRSSTPDAEARTKPQVDAASARERVEERAPATREEVERRGADALAYVLGGGGGAMVAIAAVAHVEPVNFHALRQLTRHRRLPAPPGLRERRRAPVHRGDWHRLH